MHLTKEAIEVLDFVHEGGGQREIDRVGAQEGQVGRVALVPLDPDLGRVRELAAEGELRGRRVDRDHVRALAGHCDRVLARAATDVEDAATLQVTAEPEIRLGREVGTEVDRVGAGRLAAARGQSIPRLSIRHNRGVWPDYSRLANSSIMRCASSS